MHLELRKAHRLRGEVPGGPRCPGTPRAAETRGARWQTAACLAVTHDTHISGATCDAVRGWGASSPADVRRAAWRDMQSQIYFAAPYAPRTASATRILTGGISSSSAGAGPAFGGHTRKKGIGPKGGRDRQTGAVCQCRADGRGGRCAAAPCRPQGHARARRGTPSPLSAARHANAA